MRRITILAALFLSCVMARGLEAHGKHQHHVMGTISEVAKDAIQVRTKDEETVAIALDDETEYLKLDGKDEVAATRDDLEKGRRVVVDVAERNETLLATRIVIGTMDESVPEHEHGDTQDPDHHSDADHD